MGVELRAEFMEILFDPAILATLAVSFPFGGHLSYELHDVVDVRRRLIRFDKMSCP